MTVADYERETASYNATMQGFIRREVTIDEALAAWERYRPFADAALAGRLDAEFA